ncbi:RecQ family ATP-dependent DNA helicase [Clostridium vincentii]|uniref:DNA 3'-5' helicase n=1 Tax=Clostridium vincentii TaxID=52704 RepID=A0A2T0BEK4_9CLOT|nr:RecQ family ATP-dependent DNA helicase [Clostridium vincentii]PRR82336.1 ATP-dependent DNA helicase RecQ [Clostridium vincentii]
MRDRCEELLKDMLGHNSIFHDGQYEAIESALDSKRTLVVQRTGWGKSIVYFIAAKMLKERRGGITILVSPLLSLMRNQIETAKKIGIRAVTINSENEDDWEEIESTLINGECEIVLIAPERLANKKFINRIIPAIKDGPNMIVIDEAHCISDWGHDFRPDYSRIVEIIRTLPPNIPVIATTATANNRVVDDIKRQLGDDIKIIKGSLMRESLNIQVIKLPTQGERMAWIAENIIKIEGSGIIYCSTTRDCNRISDWLQENNINALPYHAKLSSDRNEARILREEREKLLIENKVKALVSTVALGMGFDKGDLSFVIHFQMPQNIIRYYQEIGRAGRKLKDAYAILLVGKEDREIAEYFINNGSPKREQLEKVLDFIENSKEGLSSYDLRKVMNTSNSSIEKCLKLLDLHNVVAKVKSKYIRTLHPYDYDDFNVEQILETRYKELQLMEKYTDTDKCYMKFIANELDDNTCKECGKCCNCIGKEYFNSNVNTDLLKQAEIFSRSRSIKIKVRKQWPAGTVANSAKNMLKQELNEPGRALSYFGSSKFGKLVEDNRDKNEYFCDELVKASIDLIKNRWKELEHIDCVAAVPSLRRPVVVKSFAIRVAEALEVPFIDMITKPIETPKQKTMENTNMQSKNAYNGFKVNGTVKYENVLLIDDIVDSSWTLTVCGFLLNINGASRIFPYALAATTNGGGDD